MRKAIKFLGVIIFTLVLFFIVAAGALYYLIHVGEFQRFVVEEIGAKTELQIQLGEAELEVGRILGIGFRDFALSEPGASRPAITAQRVTARVAFLPLFQRKVILYGVRLYRPTARMVRDKEGRIPLLDKLLNLPFLKEEATQFGLDLQAINIVDGEVYFEDQQTERSPQRIRFRDIELEVEQVRGQTLLNFVKEFVHRKQPDPPGAALDFDLKSAVETDNEQTTLRAKGRMGFPKETLEFRKTWWNAQMQFENLPSEFVRQYFGSPWPEKAVTGVFAPRFHIEGNPTNQVRLQGALSFKNVVINAPDLFGGPLSPGEGQAEFDVDWKPQRLGISLFDFRSKDLKFTVRGETRVTPAHDMHVQLNLSAPWLPLVVLRKYLPLRMMGSPPLEGFVGGLQEGQLQLKQVGLNGTLAEIRNVAESAAKGRVWFDAELRNGGMKPNAGGYLSLQGVQGLLRLEKGVLTFQDLNGNYGQSRFTDIDGRYELVPGGKGNLEIRALGDVDLTELREQIKLGAFPAQMAKLSSSVTESEARDEYVLVCSG